MKKPAPKPKIHPVKRRRELLAKNGIEFLGEVQGRKSLYNPNVHPAVAFYTVFTGGSQEEVAKKCGISMSTLVSWKRQHQEFADAVNAKTDHILGDAVSALVKRALGFVVEDQEIVYKQHVNKATGEIIQSQDVKVFRKNYPPDTGALICLLANRDPSNWRRSDSPLQGLQDKPSSRIAAEIPTAQLEDIAREAKATPSFSNWDKMGTEEEFSDKLKRMVFHDTEEPS